MTQRKLKRFDVPFRIQVLIPSILCLAALFAGLFWVAVPFVHDQLYTAKRDMICEMTETVWFLLQSYHIRVQSGELNPEESKTRAINRIRSMRYGPESSNYFWIVDLSGKVMLNPIGPELEGKNGLDIVDINGKRLVEEMIRIANEEEDGLLEYYWPRLDNPDLPIPKLSYVRLFEPWGWIIGTGVYKEDIDAQIDQIIWYLQKVFLGCLLLLTGLAVWMALLSRRIERRRRIAEHRLAASEKQHRTSLENMLCGFVLMELITDDSGKTVDALVIQVNPAALHIANLPLDPTGRRMGDLFPDTVAERMAEIEKLIRSGLPLRDEKYFTEFGRWLEVLAFSPQPDRFAITFTDITERKTAEQALKASEERFRNLVEASPDGIWEIDAEIRYTYCSPQYSQLLGYEPGELIGRTPFDLMPPDEVESIRIRFNEYARNQRPFFNIHNTCYRKDGSPIILETSGVPFFDDQGRFRGYRGVDRDITERKRILDTLQQNERQLRLIVENAMDMISSHTPDGTILYVSPSCRGLLGYEPNELLGHKASDFIHPDDITKIRGTIQSAAQCRNHEYQDEHRIRCKSGEYVWVEDQARLLYNEVGELVEIQCSVREITERRKNDEALRILNSRHQAILAAIPDIVAEVDVTHRYTWLNPAGLAFYGDDAVGRFAHDYFIGDQQTYQSVQSLFNGGDETVYVESWQRRKDGKRRLLAWWCRPLKDARGRVIGALSTARDITEAQFAQRQREQLLANLEMKNEELQSILYTASHDLRSPLVNIQGFGGELERSCGKLRELLTSCSCGSDSYTQLQALLSDAVPEALHFVKAGADKIQMLLDGLLRLSRVGSIEITLETLDMNALLGKVLHAQRFQIQQRSAEIVVDPLPPCRGDKVMINQLFSNLIDNSLKYSDPSRPCRIRLSGQANEDCVVYSVTDNGIGIEPEHQQEIFQIFYRLRPGGEVPGEGLGLAIVKRILDRLHGSVRIESTPGQGTIFRVLLPRPDFEQ